MNAGNLEAIKGNVISRMKYILSHFDNEKLDDLEITLKFCVMGLEKLAEDTDNVLKDLKKIDFEVGDKVSIAGTLTGLGDLVGFVSEILISHDQVLVFARYDQDSKEKACGALGVIGHYVFFKRLSSNY